MGHKTRVITGSTNTAEKTFKGNWIAMIIVGGLSGAGGTFILNGGISPGSREITTNPGKGFITCISAATTYTILLKLGVEKNAARILIHVLNAVDWTSKAAGQHLDVYGWLHAIFNNVAPHTQLKHKDDILTPEQLAKV